MDNGCFGLRNLSSLEAASIIVATVIGASLSSAHPVGIAVKHRDARDRGVPKEASCRVNVPSPSRL